MLKTDVSRIKIDREVWELGIELLKAKHQDEAKRSIELKQKYQHELEFIDKKLERLLQLRMDEEITSLEYAEQKNLIVDRQSELEEYLGDRKMESKHWLERAENFFETAFQARDIMEGEDMDRKRELVRSVGWNLVLRDRKLEFSFKKPFDILLQPEITNDVQGCKDLNLEKQFWRLL